MPVVSCITGYILPDIALQGIFYLILHCSLLHKIQTLRCTVEFVLQEMCAVCCMLHGKVVVHALRRVCRNCYTRNVKQIMPRIASPYSLGCSAPLPVKTVKKVCGPEAEPCRRVRNHDKTVVIGVTLFVCFALLNIRLPLLSAKYRLIGR